MQGQIEVCLYCGTREPRLPVPNCAHGRTAFVDSSAAQRLAAQLESALRNVETLRLALSLTVEKDGARVVHRPSVRSPGANVVFLMRRDELVDERGDPLPIEKIYPRREEPKGVRRLSRKSAESQSDPVRGVR